MDLQPVYRPSHQGPARGTPILFGKQDARSVQAAGNNFAVEPAAGTGSLKLKRNAVKVVNARLASTTSSAKSNTGPPSMPEIGSTVPKNAESPGPAQFATKHTSETAASILTSVTAKTGVPRENKETESALDDLFARLNAKMSSTTSSATKDASPASPGSAPFEGIPSPVDTATKDHNSSHMGLSTASETIKNPRAVVTHVAQEQVPKLSKEATETMASRSTQQWKDLSQDQLEHEYLRKANEYFSAIPECKNVSVQTIKTVFTKLLSSYDSAVNPKDEELKRLKSRYTFAIVSFLNRISKKNAKSVTAEFVTKALQDNNGNMLGLYTTLVKQQCLSLDSIHEIEGLCKIILDALPKAEPITAPLSTKSQNTKMVVSDAKPVSPDHVDRLKTWPTQEKREAPPAYRACILKGVSGIKSINEIQALVWGGRIESIVLPNSGSDFAVVRFLTAEGCETYLKATANGIEVLGNKKMVVFVEKQPGPSSINDVIRHCIESDTSRCVRAIDAKEDWSDKELMTLARGKSATKREVDCIKHGKTARGRFYIEFRFANIFNALQFKRELVDELEWEHCIIAYATDPCEVAHGIHFKDEAEEDSSTLRQM
ncbi:hypothetical protein GQ44DRAFT_618625 [Phaeosphaeriaceae sp. PMI808]|nr:hypothetical protein GQ44DRAFT_618625 [Phaeosphaeriaceae sp. PMI808]